MFTRNIVNITATPINGLDLKEEQMPSLRLDEIDELLTDEDELSEIEIRRRRRKEERKRKKPERFTKHTGGELDSTDSD